ASESAWNTWSAVTCAVPKASYAGLSSTVPIADVTDSHDLYNVAPVWVETAGDSTYADVFGAQNIAAISLPLTYAGELQSCDTYLNAVDFDWTTDGAVPNTLDVETVLLHEAGHCLGLDHFFVAGGNVMQSTVTPGLSRRALAPIDADALCMRYPSTNAVGAPCEPTAVNACGAAALRCVTQPLPQGATERFCTRGCAVGPNAQCELPLVCLAASYFADAGFDGACLRSTSNVTHVGAPCADETTCGSAVALCQPWVGGYCSQRCGAGHVPCPAGSSCVGTAGEDLCLASCRPGLADCRAGYVCALTERGGGVCLPNCTVDADCAAASEYQCRVCDGMCVAKQNSGGHVGDVCTADTQCGFGQVCVALNGASTRLCTQACGSECARCPAGTTCHGAGLNGARVCLRDCSGPGTCAAGLQCGLLSTGRGCLPPCTDDLQCPVGTRCAQGECLMSQPDAGCDDCGGDGGLVTGRPAGCGCQTGFAFETFATMGLVLLWARRRERHS
ncbi:MAG: matrixin family metalloprotease, partial [Myxococcaceae bacterium]|nr:matrixin family metalloprotease [Myxococcaceae bacterium]